VENPSIERIEERHERNKMDIKGKYLSWIAAGIAVSGLAMTPAIARVLSSSDPVSLSALGSIGSFTPANVDPDLAASFELKALRGNKSFRFTPAGQNSSGSRAVTVLVRQPVAAKAVNIRPAAAAGPVGAGPAPVPAKLAPISYSLGAAKGWQNFVTPIKNVDGLPDLAELGAGDKKLKTNKKSRFNTRLAIDPKKVTGATPGGLVDRESQYSVDVQGSFSVTRNLAVTAGVRLESERDRLAPLTDTRSDNQAVYVGTQFRF